MDTLRLTLNKKLEDVFKLLELEFKPLSRTEIVKLALSDIYQKAVKKNSHYFLSQDEEKSLNQALKSRTSAKLNSDSEIDKYFKKLDA